jgi:GTP-dependent dephospho-CoA kinase
VGDATTSKLLSYGIIPDLFIVDGKERRKKRDTSKVFTLMLEKNRGKVSHMRCSNKPGSISGRAIKVIKNALKGPFPIRIFVCGEEDLLALPLFVVAPDKSVIIYGQPLRGMVIVRNNEDIRRTAKNLIYKIRRESGNNMLLS